MREKGCRKLALPELHGDWGFVAKVYERGGLPEAGSSGVTRGDWECAVQVYEGEGVSEAGASGVTRGIEL